MNLNLAKGKRIKLDESFDDHVDPPSSARSNLASASSSSKSRPHPRPRPPPPSFDLEFADLADDHTIHGRDLTHISDADDDDLPDARELIQSATQKMSTKSVSAKKESSPSTNYDDTEIDALIAETNFDDVLDLTAIPTSPLRETSMALGSSPPVQKRKLALDAKTSYEKRAKLSHPPVSTISPSVSPPPKKTSRVEVRLKRCNLSDLAD